MAINKSGDSKLEGRDTRTVPNNQSSLDRSINKLENLLTKTDESLGAPSAIPVLKDTITPSDVPSHKQLPKATPEYPKQVSVLKLSKLMDALDKKITAELDAFVSNFKDSIIEELKTQLKLEIKKQNAQPPKEQKTDTR